LALAVHALALAGGALALAVRALAWELALLAGELAASTAGTTLVLLGVEAIPRVAYRRTAEEGQYCQHRPGSG
jgi:hypothetical protein